MAEMEEVRHMKSACNLPPLGRQSSVFSLTLDEFQRTISGSGKNFGSMNMDEFLSSIWTAEESQHHHSAASNGGDLPPSSGNELNRQGSLSLPLPLCRKTVDEVWSEIHRGRGQSAAVVSQTNPTFGEMTLEDFLVKAGVVRENGNASSQGFRNVNAGIGFGGRQVSNRVGYGVRSASPASYSDGMMVVDGGNGFGVRNRKRVVDGPVEKVVERRQRRMIKNRESAARSRARKQAYTVELEAELNQLKEENKQLKEALAELERKRRLQYMEEMRLKMPSKARKTIERLKAMRRTTSCPF